MPARRVLLVEDTASQAGLTRALLRQQGLEERWAADGTAALALAAAWPPDAVLMDLGLPDMPGFEVMRRLRAQGCDAAVIVVTAQGSIATAVEAMREGAADFLVKPFAPERLRVTLGNVLDARALRAELTAANQTLRRSRFHGFIGASPVMQAAYRTIEAVAPSRAAVWISGESGTGKELAAAAIHQCSPRARGPFVALNCAAIPKDLLESEIFGHVRGAFTGATEDRPGAARLADGGTLFLDEVAEMPLEMQVKLLRFVQSGSVSPVGAGRPMQVDVRFVCATNRDIAAEVAAGRFREDLFYRLHVVPLELPPLRERGGDVLLIARQLLTQYAKEEGKAFARFDAEAEAALLAQPWPGNVRQLQNVLRAICVLHNGEVVTPAMLPAALATSPEAPALTPMVEPLHVVEKRAILRALDATGQDVARAAALLEVNASTLYRKLAAWNAG